MAFNWKAYYKKNRAKYKAWGKAYRARKKGRKGKKGKK